MGSLDLLRLVIILIVPPPRRLLLLHKHLLVRIRTQYVHLLMVCLLQLVDIELVEFYLLGIHYVRRLVPLTQFVLFEHLRLLIRPFSLQNVHLLFDPANFGAGGAD